MVHKGLQRHIVCEDSLSTLCTNAPICTGRVRGRGVELGEQEARLRTPGIANNESWQWETICNEILDQKLVEEYKIYWKTYSRILLGLLQQSCEIFISLLLVIACFSPFRDSLAVEDEDVEECVKK